jgi:hypothetical protein
VGDDLTAALLPGREPRDDGPGPFVRRCDRDALVGRVLGDRAARTAAQTLTADEPAGRESPPLRAKG